MKKKYIWLNQSFHNSIAAVVKPKRKTPNAKVIITSFFLSEEKNLESCKIDYFDYE